MRRGERDLWSLISIIDLRSLIIDLRSGLEKCTDASGMHRGCIEGALRVLRNRHLSHQGCRDVVARWVWKTARSWACGRSAAGAVVRTAVESTAWTQRGLLHGLF